MLCSELLEDVTTICIAANRYWGFECCCFSDAFFLRCCWPVFSHFQITITNMELFIRWIPCRRLCASCESIHNGCLWAGDRFWLRALQLQFDCIRMFRSHLLQRIPSVSILRMAKFGAFASSNSVNKSLSIFFVFVLFSYIEIDSWVREENGRPLIRLNLSMASRFTTNKKTASTLFSTRWHSCHCWW